MNYPAVLALVMLFAGLDWLAVWQENKRLEYFTKPAPLLALIAWFSLNGGFQGALVWAGAALVFALVGDILLMLPDGRKLLPSGRGFLAGLGAFLACHLAYLVALNPGEAAIDFGSLLVLAAVLGAGLVIFHPVERAIKARSSPVMLWAVRIYALVLSLVLASALSVLVRAIANPQEWSLTAALWLSAGASLFFLSDTLLAYGRFVSPRAGGRVLVHLTYHLGQIGLALGFLLQAAR
jgi:alkenylglycerophosphocholine hydrolase